MILGAYTTDLYCDCHECKRDSKIHGFKNIHEQFIGRSQTQTFRIARRQGWRISNDLQRAFAPGHKITRDNNLNKNTRQKL